MIFADDIKLYISFDISQGDSSIAAFQQNLDTLVRISQSWGLSLNPSKCVCLRFGARNIPFATTGLSPYKINDNYLNFCSSHTDLGVTIDTNLKFHSHISAKVNTANALTNNIFSCTLCRDRDFLLNIYRSIIRPQLEYGSALWNVGYIMDTRLVERVQRRWTKAIAGMEEMPYHARLRELNLFSLQGRLLRTDMILLWKIFHGECGINPEDLFSLISNSVTRGHPFKIFVPRSNLDIRQRFFSCRVIRTWNSLSRSTVLAETVSAFKSLLSLDLGQLLFDYID